MDGMPCLQQQQEALQSVPIAAILQKCINQDGKQQTLSCHTTAYHQVSVHALQSPFMLALSVATFIWLGSHNSLYQGRAAMPTMQARH
jgi:hypothetical protein